MFVLARDPSRYRYLKVLDCIQPPGEAFDMLGEDALYYRIVMPRPSGPLTLPTRSMCWTSTAFVVWDDVLPSVLSPEQQQAMLEWLHWGGGLIISGPQTLDALRGSFLEPYLSATRRRDDESRPERAGRIESQLDHFRSRRSARGQRPCSPGPASSWRNIRTPSFCPAPESWWRNVAWDAAGWW